MTHRPPLSLAEAVLLIALCAASFGIVFLAITGALFLAGVTGGCE